MQQQNSCPNSIEITAQEDPETLASYSYTPTGHLAKVTYGDPSASQVKERYVYDVRDWRTDYHVKYRGTDIFSQVVDYFGATNIPEDPLNPGQPLVPPRYDGSITAIQEDYVQHLSLGEFPEQRRYFNYGPAGQLLDAHSHWYDEDELLALQSRNSYLYDRNGNRVQEIRTNVPSEGTTLTSTSSQHDHTIATGSNRLSYVSVGTDYTLDFDLPGGSYDALGNITRFEKDDGTPLDTVLAYGNPMHPILPSNITKDTLSVDFAYDTNGARISRSENGVAQYYLPAGTENLAEMDQFGRITRAYVFEGGNRLGYKSKRQAGLYVKDHLGSTKMVVAMNRSSFGEAVLTAAMDSDPYGNTWRDLVDTENGGVADPHGYTGQEREEALGLMYYGARYYMPEIGRFLEVDPARQFVNPYSYVGNSPLSASDPTGSEGMNIQIRVWHNQILEHPQGTPERLRAEQRVMEEAYWKAWGAKTAVFFWVEVAADTYGDAFALVTGYTITGEETPRLYSAAAIVIPFVGVAIVSKIVKVRRAKSTVDSLHGVDFSHVFDDFIPTKRGDLIEDYLAVTDYKDWYHVGNENNGFFELVDFQKGDVLVSLKTVDTRGANWMKRMKEHIRDLGSRGAKVNGQPANMVLDLRVQPGGQDAALSLINYGAENNVNVIIKEVL